MTGYDRVIQALDDQGSLQPSWRGGYQALCPAHDDTRSSLSVAEGDDGRALVYCHAGCDVQDVVRALGLEMSDLFADGERVVVAQYTYRDEDDRPLIRVTRYQPKGFTQERYNLDEGNASQPEWTPGLGDVRRVPYRLHDLVAANPEDRVFVVEGEKDADNLAEEGAVATTLLGGAGKWRDEYADYFRGLNVTVVADSDEAGMLGATKVAENLRRVAASVRVVLPREGKDATDHLLAGYGLDDFHERDEKEVFQPLDWDVYETPEQEWLFKPYVPRAARVLMFGKAGSLKSLWAMWLAARIAREGGRVAYFSLEMRPSQAVERVRKFRPPKDRFLLFSRYALNNPDHRELAIRALRGYDLIVVDSWNASHQFFGSRGTADDQVAVLDNDFFQPLVDQTGATLLLLDNTGHDAVTDDGPVKMKHARGSSAKGDKMDVCIYLDRPYDDNNYMTTISVTKMRYDVRIPAPVTVVAPEGSDPIEFHIADQNGNPTAPMWPEFGAGVTPGPPLAYSPAPSTPAPVKRPIKLFEDAAGSTTSERLRLARIKDRNEGVEFDA